MIIREGEKYNERISLLKDIYTTTRMIGNDPGKREFDVAQGGEYPTVTASLNLESA